MEQASEQSRRIEYLDGIPVYIGYSDAEMREIWLAEAKRQARERPITWDEAREQQLSTKQRKLTSKK